jgi:hypothetical protein
MCAKIYNRDVWGCVVADGHQIKEGRVGWSEVEAEFGESGARVVACVWRGGGAVDRLGGVEKMACAVCKHYW